MLYFTTPDGTRSVISSRYKKDRQANSVCHCGSKNHHAIQLRNPSAPLCKANSAVSGVPFCLLLLSECGC